MPNNGFFMQTLLQFPNEEINKTARFFCFFFSGLCPITIVYQLHKKQGLKRWVMKSN